MLPPPPLSNYWGPGPSPLPPALPTPMCAWVGGYRWENNAFGQTGLSLAVRPFVTFYMSILSSVSAKFNIYIVCNSKFSRHKIC